MAQIDWQIKLYSKQQAPVWDTLIDNSRNATFLLRRPYLEYHADRFADSSFIAYAGDKPMALLPANRVGDELHSHQGLTYGGWVLPTHKIDGDAMMSLTDAWLLQCRREGIKRIFYKPLPHIYAQAPSQEDIYALWRHGATLHTVLLSSAIDTGCNPGFDYLRRRYLKRVEEAGVSVGESCDWAAFWSILEQCLCDRHHASPVHTLQEMQKLQQLFPDNIKLYTAADADGIQAGVVIYHTPMANHCQYIATTPKGRSMRYLPFLFRSLIDQCRCRYFDFGTSNEDGGRRLNASLLANKFGYGATGVAYPQYRLDL